MSASSDLPAMIALRKLGEIREVMNEECWEEWEDDVNKDFSFLILVFLPFSQFADGR